ncbi:von Willebrand factor A domain-containing protein 5A-like isoform X1 [Entelurus aequoreus]|uniref:von Willebrand factor A domain-containing protein 5A-like isoform X1 n=1 Tax=Entelurus aequoreus TaxID=161455 RepID=UPI002B1DEAE7|nr:von Willebrand factor A domain-containing protein 5A-like isoform X1 [Entelurus aequoreus]XP_061916045.1 von Willebrand factor A domain-containing protein 5A-like isoform X1 [Entelurus aequoreus]
MVRRCGLLTNNREPVPLKGIEVALEVKDHVATVVSTLHYDNKEDKAIEAVFVFPLPGDAAVCHFSAKVGQTEIVAEVKEKQEAREEYDDALSSGQQAFLLEESEQSSDIFSLSVGSLPPGESASIRLEYIIELAVQADDALRFCLPAVLNPRYQPQGSEGGGVQVTSVPASQVPYSLSFSARVSSPRQVSKIDSNCSLEPLQYLNAEQSQAVVKLAAGHKFDRDVELLIYYQDAHQPAAVVEAGQVSAKPGTLMGDAVVMLSVYPEFPQAVMSSLASSGEFVFLLDRSGSMSGTRISSARDTLLLLLKSLPMGCYFNIYSFGSSFEHIFPTSVEYSEKTMEEALKKVKEMQANLGGTEILQPLKHIYNQPCIPSQPRQLFVFTDGEVGNTKEVTSLVKKNSTSHRCFSFGIGEGASTALINGMAKEGGGHAQFITGADRMQPKVMQTLQFALQPAVEDISVTWDLPQGVTAIVLSPPLTAIFQGQRSLIYAQLTGQSSEAKDCFVTVKYNLAGHPTQNQIPFTLQPTEETGLTIHRLSARTVIRSLETEKNNYDLMPFMEREDKKEEEDGVKQKVVELSVQSGVSSSHTAFIAVHKGESSTTQGPLLRQIIPVPSFRNMPQTCLRGMPISPPNACSKLRMMCYLSPSLGDCDSMRKRMVNAGRKNFEEQNFDLLKMGMRSSKKKSAPSTRNSADSCVEKTLASSSPTDPLLQLVSLQKASGSWELKPTLAAVLGKTSKEVEKLKPASANENVWATILALVWLHGFKSDAEVEWKLLARKAASWLLSLNAPSVTDCVVAANTLLGCNVQKDTLGL